MFAVATAQGGLCQATAPDVCKVPAPPGPPVPTPMPNIVDCAQALQVSVKVKVLNMPILTKQSQWPTSMGDNAGVAGGVVSGMNMGPVTVKEASPLLAIEGSDAVRQGNLTAHNGSNANTVGLVAGPLQAILDVAR